MTRLLFFLSFLSLSLSAQSIDDYRTNGSDGNWTNTAIWEVFNGTIWVAATNYPGQVAGTNDVSIEGNSEVTLNSTIPNSFNSLTIGPGDLFITSDSSLDTPLITLNTGGIAEWTNNNTDLALPANAAIVINGGNLSEDNPCNATKTLTIGSTVYASCNGGGGGVDFSFEDINTSGGSLNVTPSSNSPICVGVTLTLFANPSGVGSSGASFSWSGTGPGGYSFSSGLENPIETGITATGSYTYTVTITDSDSNTNSATINVIVQSPPSAPVSVGDQTACTGNSGTLTATVNTGETVDWYDAAIGGTLLLAGNINFTTTIAGSYFAETRNTTTGCISTNRTEVVLTTRSCTVITNRTITYRVTPTPIITVTPTGTPTSNMIVSFFADGQFGPFNAYQLQVQNTSPTAFNYEILIENVPYASIPGLNLVNHTLEIGTNGDGTFDYLYTSTSPLGGFQTRQIFGSGSAPSPPGTGVACGCISFFSF